MSTNIISRIDSKITLEYILTTKESVIFERKWVFKPDGTIWFTPSKVTDVVIWMLNAEWWVLVLWVNNWFIEDLSSLSSVKLHDYKQIVLDMITPPCFVNIEEVLIEWKLILLYHIESDKERVFARKDNEKVFFRNWDEIKELDRERVRKLEYDKSIRRFEDEKREDFQESDFRVSVLEFYKNKINFEWTYNDLLLYRNLAIKEQWRYIYKNSAILLFAQNPENYIPSASVRYIRYDGNRQTTGTSLNVVKDERFEWCIPMLIETVKAFLNTIFKDYYFLDLESWKFLKVPEYPEEAWLEWIVNSLTHRSYNLQWNVIYIKHFDDRIEVSNSWPLPSIVTIENIKETRFSRNPRIARVLTEMWYVRELNEWVNRIYDSMKKMFLSEPEYIDRSDIVTLILKNNISKHEDTISEKSMKEIEKTFPALNDTQKQMLRYLIVYKKATINDFKSELGISEQMIREYLKRFNHIIQKDTDKIRDKNASYRLKK